MALGVFLNLTQSALCRVCLCCCCCCCPPDYLHLKCTSNMQCVVERCVIYVQSPVCNVQCAVCSVLYVLIRSTHALCSSEKAKHTPCGCSAAAPCCPPDCVQHALCSVYLPSVRLVQSSMYTLCKAQCAMCNMQCTVRTPCAAISSERYTACAVLLPLLPT